MKPSKFYHLAGRIHELAFVLHRGEETLATVCDALIQSLEDPERTEREDCAQHHARAIRRGVEFLGEELRALQRELTQVGDATVEPEDGITLERVRPEVGA